MPASKFLCAGLDGVRMYPTFNYQDIGINTFGHREERINSKHYRQSKPKQPE
jgi:hypothetical protein